MAVLTRFYFDYPEPIAVAMRQKSKKRGTLSVQDKTAIVHKALVDHELFRDVAKEYRVGVMTVQRLVTKARAHP